VCVCVCVCGWVVYESSEIKFLLVAQETHNVELRMNKVIVNNSLIQ